MCMHAHSCAGRTCLCMCVRNNKHMSERERERQTDRQKNRDRNRKTPGGSLLEKMQERLFSLC